MAKERGEAPGAVRASTEGPPAAERPDKISVTADDLAALLQLQQSTTAALIAERAEELSQRRRSREENEHCKAECEKPAQQRTQEAADRLFQGPRKWAVSLPGDKMHVHPIVIRANSPEEAEGRYRQINGILSTDHPFVVAPV